MGWWSFDDDPPDETAQRESENSARQAQHLTELSAAAAALPERYVLTLAVINNLNRLAVDGLAANPGKPRERSDQDLEIFGSKHVPPPSVEVAALLDDMIGYINSVNASAIHISAYALWRLNWIHPYENGNGRTARALSYLLLCAYLKQELPGETTIIERMLWQKIRYWRCLESADEAWTANRLDVGALEELIEELLQAQLEFP